MGDTYPKARVGVVQAASVFLNRPATVAKAIHYIEEAGRNGLDLVGFPEGFIPAHPVWYHFEPATAPRSMHFAAELFKNCVTIPGPEVEALCAAAARSNVHVVMGLCEKRPDTMGTMYNTQLFISRTGEILGRHRKLMATVGERLVHSVGFGDGLRVYDTDIGKIGGLICGENSNPLALFALAAEGLQIHVASWPNHFYLGNPNPMSDAVTFISRAVAFQCNCFVLNACAVISDEMRELLPVEDEQRAFMSDPEKGGGSSIIGANSRILAGPMSGAEEGLLWADINLEDCVRSKLARDLAGHYNRPDVFTLTVNKTVPSLTRTVGDASSGSAVEAPGSTSRGPAAGDRRQ